MKKLQFRELNNKNDIERYIEKVEDYSGVRLPYNYAKESTIVGVFLQKTLVGGYMLVTKPEFRSLMFLPDKIKSSCEFLKKDKFEMMEVNGLWVGPSIKTPQMQFRFWIRLLRDIFFCRKKYLLMMSNRKHKAIERIHNLTDPVNLYEGESKLLGGQKTHEDIRIAYTTRWRMVFNIPKYYLELRQREARLSTTFKQRVYART